MLLMSGGKLSATITAAQRDSNVHDDTPFLPSISKTAAAIPFRRAKSRAEGSSLPRGLGREALESKASIPNSLDAHRYASSSLGFKTVRFGWLPPDEDEEDRRRALEEAAAAGSREVSCLGEEEINLASILRAEIM